MNKVVAIFAFALVALSLVVKGQELECYSCNSAADTFDCKDGYSRNQSHLLTCGIDYNLACPDSTVQPKYRFGCQKSKITISRNVQVSRNCYANCEDKRQDVCEKTVLEDGNLIQETCFCFGYKCNSAGSLTSAITLAMIPLLTKLF